jgi:hypothetical protein
MHTTPTAARAHDRQQAYLASATQARLARHARAAGPAISARTPGPIPTSTSWLIRVNRIRAVVTDRRQIAVSR